MERKKLEEECGFVVVKSWYESGQVTATRLQIPLEEQHEYITRFVDRQYQQWRTNG